MVPFELIDQPWKDEAWYQDQWRSFYRQRMQKVSSMGKTCVAIGAGALLFGLTPGKWLEIHPVTANIFAAAGGILWLTLGIQWFTLNWQMTSWDCPRCDETFFASTWVRNPFARRCLHCRLPRPRQRDLGPRNSRSTPAPC